MQWTTMDCFGVYLDGERLADIAPTKAACKAWIRGHVLSTHMGEWRRVNKIDYHYHTSFGRIYCFMRDKSRLSTAGA